MSPWLTRLCRAVAMTRFGARRVQPPPFVPVSPTPASHATWTALKAGETESEWQCVSYLQGVYPIYRVYTALLDSMKGV